MFYILGSFVFINFIIICFMSDLQWLYFTMLNVSCPLPVRLLALRRLYPAQDAAPWKCVTLSQTSHLSWPTPPTLHTHLLGQSPVAGGISPWGTKPHTVRTASSPQQLEFSARPESLTELSALIPQHLDFIQHTCRLCTYTWIRYTYRIHIYSLLHVGDFYLCSLA